LEDLHTPAPPPYADPITDWGEGELEDCRARLRELGEASRLGVDTGGTFTDFVLLENDRVTTWKARSCPEDPGRPVREVLARSPQVAAVLIGTTVGANALIERRGARVALVTTEGFTDLLDLRRQDRQRLYDLKPPPNPSLVPAELRFGAEERILASGGVESALDARRLRSIVEWVDRSEAEAIAVMFLHSYANDGHERIVARALRDAFPGSPLSASSEVHPEPREYERLVATVVNAYIGPVVSSYLDGLGGEGRPLLLSISSGGLLPEPLARKRPLHTLLSGPAAGVLGAHGLARDRGLGPLLTLDMGGTSTDAGWVDPGDAIPPLSTQGEVGGWPMAWPTVDVTSVGAGGGSLARTDDAGALVLGPESAGSDPGPAAFGKGFKATLTDALVVLGVLPVDVPLSGGIRLRREAALAALAELGSKMSRPVQDVALSIRDAALARMERALRRVSSARGRDPRQASLLAFGGAGGLFAANLAARLGMGRVLVPPCPGVFSAWATLRAPLRVDWSRTVSIPASELDGGSPFAPFWSAVGHFVPALPSESGFHCFFGARYPGESHDILVPAGGDWEETFHERHARHAGHSRRSTRPMVTALRMAARYASAALPLPSPQAPEAEPGPPRPVLFDRSGPVLTPVVSRTVLTGSRVRGPMVIVEKGAAALVPPGSTARAVEGLLVIDVEGLRKNP
jgi:N-methylhydantoinase A